MTLAQALAVALIAATFNRGSGTGPAPGTIHFEDGRVVKFDDLLKFRFGPHPGHILLEPRGIYVQSGSSNVQIPADELREIRVSDFRPARAEGCAKPCGLSAVTFAVANANGTQLTATAGFVDAFLVLVRTDEWSEPTARSVAWAKVGRDGTTTLNVRRITFTPR